MEQNYFVYKLFNPDYPEFYIGSTKDMKQRKRHHKFRCNNENDRFYNLKVYQYIRDHGGYSSWKYEILEHITTSINKYELHDLERKAIEDMKPSLNERIPNRTMKEYKHQKFNCICGGKYIKSGEARHMKTAKHINFINQ